MKPKLTILTITARTGFVAHVLEETRSVAERNQQDPVLGFYHLEGDIDALMILSGLDHAEVASFVCTNFGGIRGAIVKAHYVKASFAPPFTSPQIQFSG